MVNIIFQQQQYQFSLTQILNIHFIINSKTVIFYFYSVLFLITGNL